MASTLCILVRFHQGRYLGTGDWPPAPGRLFQALVAGAGAGGPLSEAAQEALLWLEAQDPPSVFAPRAKRGAPLTRFVPNNDLDAKGGDPENVASLRRGKQDHPMLFDQEQAVVFAWEGVDAPPLQALTDLADGMMRLGRGVDQAWAELRWIPQEEVDPLTSALRAFVPTPGATGGVVLAAPCAGTLDSLMRRHGQLQQRLRVHGKGRGAKRVFVQGDAPLMRQCAYNGRAEQVVLELQGPEGFHPWPAHRSVALVETVRDQALVALQGVADPHLFEQAQRYLSGKVRGAKTSERVQLVPLPSIGHEKVDGAIRRLLVRIPSDCPMDPADVLWAIGRARPTPQVTLVPSQDDAFFERHFGVKGRSRWQSLSPLALPLAKRRRLEPGAAGRDKGPGERLDEHRAAEAAVVQALRHAGVRARVRWLQVQREPFHVQADMAERYASGPRFAKEGLWHVRLELERPVKGPLVIGNGRFLGLGLLVPQPSQALTLAIPVLSSTQERAMPRVSGQALRRAMMARWQALLGPGAPLPVAVCGHLPDGRPAKERSRRITYAYDPRQRQLLVHLPAGLEALHPQLRQVLTGFEVLKAGAAGVFTLGPARVLQDPELVGRHQRWTSLTSYALTRHGKGSVEQSVRADVQLECERAGLPLPQVAVLEHWGVQGRGVHARVVLEFERPISGPLRLGKERYSGGGLFLGSAPEERAGG